MVKKLITTVRKVGGSYGVTLPKEFAEKNMLIESDIIELLLIGKIDKEIPIKSYICKACKHQFDKELNEDKFCPVCEHEDLEEVE